MTQVFFYNPEFEPEAKITYSVITARYRGKWLFVRHHNRLTWEIAAGHIERGETPYVAACRELMEETGALKFSIDCMATYSVDRDGTIDYGRLYLAEVFELGPVPDAAEIAETKLFDHLPENLTYPDIQPVLFRKCME